MRKTFAILLLAAGCTQTPELTQSVSDESLAASYPKLIALEGQDPFATATTGSDVIEELDDRTANLWSRIGSLF